MAPLTKKDGTNDKKGIIHRVAVVRECTKLNTDKGERRTRGLEQTKLCRWPASIVGPPETEWPSMSALPINIESVLFLRSYERVNGRTPRTIRWPVLARPAGASQGTMVDIV